MSQNYGAHKFKRIKRGFGSSLVISSVIASLFVAACLIFTEPLINLFMAQGEDVELAMSSAAQYIRIVAPFYLVVNVKVNADATVRGCNGNVGFMVSTFSDLISVWGWFMFLRRLWALPAWVGHGQSAGCSARLSPFCFMLSQSVCARVISKNTMRS